MQTIAFCERDEFCRAVLAKHWPGIPCFDDIHTLDADRLAGLGRVDLICGGFPCQPFSTAGKQAAQADDRHLWPEMCRVIALTRPAWAIGENVVGIITLALDDVLADLEGLGYTARAFVIPACAVDAKHRRDRIWIIARNTDNEGEPIGAEHAEMAELCSAVADPGGSRRSGQGSSGVTGNPEAHSPRGASNQPWNGGIERIWSPEPSMGRVAPGVPRRMDRLRALGNAVVPQVVYELGRAIMSIG